jgi:carnosine N-methyltransferase
MTQYSTVSHCWCSLRPYFLCDLSTLVEPTVYDSRWSCLRQYRKAAHYNITYLRRQSFYTLPSAHLDLLSEPPFSLQSTFRAVDDAIDANADIAESILEFCLPAFGIDAADSSWHGKATPNDMDKARSTIKQIYRDWSAEGSIERDPSYRLIFSALASHQNPEDQPSQRHRSCILVPGAGLGRLVLELCASGYSVQGNEISYHQILASNYLLNGTRKAGRHMLYPWALIFSNHLTRANQLQSVSVPDINPMAYLEEGGEENVQSEIHYSERLSMASGDFCALYRQAEYENHFGAVVTHFFIDTAPNVINYIETVRQCLRPGGIWVNLGPLLWHFESSPTPAEREKERHEGNVGYKSQKKNANEGIGDPGSFELTNEEVLALLQRLGFEILEQSEALAGVAGYVQDPQSMLQNMYRPAFWVAKKTDV